VPDTRFILVVAEGGGVEQAVIIEGSPATCSKYGPHLFVMTERHRGDWDQNCDHRGHRGTRGKAENQQFCKGSETLSLKVESRKPKAESRKPKAESRKPEKPLSSSVFPCALCGHRFSIIRPQLPDSFRRAGLDRVLGCLPQVRATPPC